MKKVERISGGDFFLPRTSSTNSLTISCATGNNQILSIYEAIRIIRPLYSGKNYLFHQDQLLVTLIISQRHVRNGKKKQNEKKSRNDVRHDNKSPRIARVIHVSRGGFGIREEARKIRRRLVRAFTSELAASLSARRAEKKEISAECKYDKNPRVIRLTRTGWMFLSETLQDARRDDGIPCDAALSLSFSSAQSSFDIG